MRAWPFLVLVLVALAGCVTPSTLPAASLQTANATSGWALDCTIGSYEKALNATWGQLCEARASHTPGAKEETWAEVNPTNPQNVVIGVKDMNPADSADCTWNDVMVTHDGGHSWKDVAIGGTYASRQPGSPFYGYACNTDPDFQFTKNGDLHYGVELYCHLCGSAFGPGPDNPIYRAVPTGEGVGSEDGGPIILATSHDGGDTWPDIITFQPDLGFLTDFSRMTINPFTQSIVEAIGSEGGQGCHVLVSRDDGKSADLFRPVLTPNGFACGSSADTAIAGSPKGVLVLIGGLGNPMQRLQGADTRTVVRSTDDGKTWLDSNPSFSFTPIRPFNNTKFRAESLIELAYDLTNGSRAGTLYAVYPAASQTDPADIFVRSSKDDGKTWSDPVKVNQDNTTSAQFMSNIAVAADGSVHVFYMDQSYDPAHKLLGLTHAVSLDGGKTWKTERVSTELFDGDLGVHQNKFPFIGDYLGVSAVGKDVWAGFPDSSNGQVTVVAAAHVHEGS
ncbi:MAG: sialidase family protein [Thermoplasmatota archaeon]